MYNIFLFDWLVPVCAVLDFYVLNNQGDSKTHAVKLDTLMYKPYRCKVLLVQRC